jgi:NAD(P)-dependent dehydrogenase (short-subunit alcohol dehydrogenase family)
MSEQVIAPDVSHKSLSELMSLTGRRAVVTGGARGIGLAITRRIAEAGAVVCIGDIDLAAAEAAASDIAGEFGPAFGLRLNIRDRSSVDGFVRAASDKLGGLDLWVNNAAIYPSNTVMDVPDDEWASVIDVDLTGTFYCCRAAVAEMLGQGQRSGQAIVNMSSVSGLRGRKGIAAYVAAKHGVTGLTRALALEVASHGIRVMGVAPSIVDTPGMRARREGLAADALRAVQELERGLIAGIPLGRQGTPDDIARIVLFCLTDMCVWLTGTVIPVDGGLTAS